MNIQFLQFILIILILVDESVGSKHEDEVVPKPPNGIFSQFLRKFLNYMEVIPKRKVSKFSSALTRALDSMPYSYSKDLAKRIKKIPKQKFGNTARLYVEFIDADPEKHVSGFMRTLDDIMTRMERSRFEHYLETISEYILGFTEEINEETRDVVTKVIPNIVEQNLTRKEKNKLLDKLDKAISDFPRQYDSV